MTCGQKEINMTWLQLAEKINELPYDEQDKQVRVFDGGNFLRVKNIIVDGTDFGSPIWTEQIGAFIDTSNYSHW